MYKEKIPLSTNMSQWKSVEGKNMHLSVECAHSPASSNGGFNTFIFNLYGTLILLCSFSHSTFCSYFMDVTSELYVR